MTQPNLFALTDGEHSEVTEGGIMTLSDHELLQVKASSNFARGDIAEYRCAEALTWRGYSCTVLGGRFKGFDLIADRDGIRAQHVQVKHGFLDGKNRYLINHKSHNRLYSATDYDIFVYYMWDRDQWLVFSRAEFGNMVGISYIPPDLRKNSRYERSGPADRQPNNWELFDQLAMANSQESVGVTQQMSDPQLYI